MTTTELADALRGLDAAELAAMIASNTQVMIAQGAAIQRLKADLTAHFDATAKQVASIIRERDEARGLLGRVVDWTHQYGAALCPTAGSADSFGDGMREAKRQVATIVAAHLGAK